MNNPKWKPFLSDADRLVMRDGFYTREIKPEHAERGAAIHRRISAGEPCGICRECKRGERCHFLQEPDFISLPMTRTERTHEWICQNMAWFTDDVMFVAFLILVLIAYGIWSS